MFIINGVISGEKIFEIVWMEKKEEKVIRKGIGEPWSLKKEVLNICVWT
jgi:hypothetical protein